MRLKMTKSAGFMVLIWLLPIAFVCTLVFMMHAAAPRPGQGYFIARRFLLPIIPSVANIAEAYSELAVLIFMVGGAVLCAWLALLCSRRQAHGPSRSEASMVLSGILMGMYTLALISYDLEFGESGWFFMILFAPGLIASGILLFLLLRTMRSFVSNALLVGFVVAGWTAIALQCNYELAPIPMCLTTLVVFITVMPITLLALLLIRRKSRVFVSLRVGGHQKNVRPRRSNSAR